MTVEYGKMKYLYLMNSNSKIYFVKYESDFTHVYSEVELKNMLEFLKTLSL
jgi:hypothetical protein